MRRLIILMVALGFVGNVVGQKPTNYDEHLKGLYKNSVELITVEDLSNQIKKNAGIVVLDTREISEYRVSHIEGARNIGYNNFSIESLQDIPKGAEIIVYCSLGVRSEQIGEKLKEAGYENVKNLYGGIFEWKYQDQIVVDKKGNPTDKVHTYDENWGQWLLKGEKVY